VSLSVAHSKVCSAIIVESSLASRDHLKEKGGNAEKSTGTGLMTDVSPQVGGVMQPLIGETSPVTPTQNFGGGLLYKESRLR
jgi:hypothetical protein